MTPLDLVELKTNREVALVIQLNCLAFSASKSFTSKVRGCSFENLVSALPLI